MISSLTILLWLAAISQCLCSIIDICSKNKNSERQPLVAALLDLHTGELCDQPVIPSFQQLAVLEATVKQINQNNKVKLGFQVFDTCSSEHGAVTASMQAFVASQQTCLHSPLFTGFIGPENIKYLRAVKNFTSSFNFSHILSYSILSYGTSLDKAVYVTKYPIIQFVEAIEAVVEKSAIKSPLIIAEEGLRSYALSHYLANHRASVKQTTDICSKRNVVTVSNQQQIEETVDFINNHDGVIFIIENDWALKTVSNMMLNTESTESPIIIVDLKNSATRNHYIWDNNVIFITQMSSSESEKNKSSMATSVSNAIQSFVSDSTRICNKHKLNSCNDHLLSSILEDDYDWTLQLYRMSTLLLGSAIKSVEESKCKTNKFCLTPEYLSQNEWHDFLSKAVYADDALNTDDKDKLHFGMNVPATYLLKTPVRPDGLKKIGRVVNGKVKLIESDYPLPISMKNVTCPEMYQDHSATIPSTQLDFLDHLLNPENAKLFEAVGLVCGAVIGILLLMLLLTTCVYRNFNPESSRPRSPSSHTTMSRAGSITS